MFSSVNASFTGEGPYTVQNGLRIAPFRFVFNDTTFTLSLSAATGTNNYVSGGTVTNSGSGYLVGQLAQGGTAFTFTAGTINPLTGGATASGYIKMQYTATAPDGTVLYSAGNSAGSLTGAVVLTTSGSYYAGTSGAPSATVQGPVCAVVPTPFTTIYSITQPATLGTITNPTTNCFLTIQSPTMSLGDGNVVKSSLGDNNFTVVILRNYTGSANTPNLAGCFTIFGR